MIVLGPYVLNLRALGARLIYRWRGRTLATLAALGLALGLALGWIPPIWRGQATLQVTAPPGATIWLDGRPWHGGPLYAGTHVLASHLPDGRRSEVTLTLAAGATRAVQLPPGQRPRQRRLGAAAPGLQLSQIWWADGAWRVQSAPAPVSDGTRAAAAASPPPVPAGPVQTLALGPRGGEPLAVIDAHGGVADQLHAQGRLIQITPGQATSGAAAMPAVVVQGWRDTPQTVPVSQTVTLARLAPDGQRALLGTALATEPLPLGYAPTAAAPRAHQLAVLRPGQSPQVITTLAGTITDVQWAPDGRLVAISSQDQNTLSLTLLRTDAPLLARLVAQRPAAPTPALARWVVSWQRAGATWAPLWIAPSDDGARAQLWRADPATLLATPLRDLEALALDASVTPMRAVVLLDGAPALVRLDADLVIVEARLPAELRTAGLGQWAPDGRSLVLVAPEAAWLIDQLEP